MATGQRADPLPEEVATLVARGRRRERHAPGWWAYPDNATRDADGGAEIGLVAVPYYVWGNRAEGAIRVWVSASERRS